MPALLRITKAEQLRQQRALVRPRKRDLLLLLRHYVRGHALGRYGCEPHAAVIQAEALFFPFERWRDLESNLDSFGRAIA